jgi:hypothetical protein
MIKLDLGNVLLKPSHRRQVMAWLKRSTRLGERVGSFELVLHLRRVKGQYEAQADVHDSLGEFGCRSRQRNWRDAVRDIAYTITLQLHDQRLRRAG